MTPEIEKTIVKYITKSATKSDLDLLSKWIKNPVNEKLFKDYVQTHYAITFSMNNPDSNKALERLLKEIKKEKLLVSRLKRKRIIKYVAAAMFIGFLVTAYVWKNDLFNKQVNETPIIVNTNINSIESGTDSIEPGTDKAVLTLEDGSQIALDKENNIHTENAVSNGEEIVYKNNDKKLVEFVFNFISVPRGGQFLIELSDGTKVWLNSESQLKYPVNFIEGETRVVELVYGEAYFDVSPSTKHMGAGFKVVNKSQEVEVLGTEFNIKAYKDETTIYTTLVEGKVDIISGSQQNELIPGEQLILNLENKSITIAKVDVNAETSWRNGLFIFRGTSLKDIMKVISRWYDVDVVFENKNLEDLSFKGVLGKNQDLQEILETIKSLSTIKSYEINSKVILLK